MAKNRPEKAFDQLSEEQLMNLAVQVAPSKGFTDRLTAMVQVHHERLDEDPFSCTAQFAAELTNKEEGWTRKVKVGTDWLSLSSFKPWVEHVGTVVLINKLPTYSQLPNAETAKADKEQVLGVSLGHNGPQLIVRPGRFAVLEPFDWQKVQLKCMAKEARVVIYLFPR